MPEGESRPVVGAQHHVRIARPSRDLDAAERFWCSGLGLTTLWRAGTDAEGGHALLMVGAPGAAWHLELVGDPAALAANPPGPEDLLVVYRTEPLTEADLARILDAGGAVVASRNPYWDKDGTTVQDPDGYRVVLTERGWG